MDWKKAVRLFSAVMLIIWEIICRGASILKEQLFRFVEKAREFVHDKKEQYEVSKQPAPRPEGIEVHPEEEDHRKILVSRCLYGGDPVHYDGKDITLRHPVFMKWKQEGRLIPVCPEVEAGMPVPRPMCERCGQKVLTEDGADVTMEFREGSLIALSFATKYNVAMAIMKEESPSCGSTYICSGQFDGSLVHGEGTAVEMLRNAGISVFSEKELVQAAGFLEALETEQEPEEEEGLKIRSGIMKADKKLWRR